jgi:uncharacterized protein (DUF1800 family)
MRNRWQQDPALAWLPWEPKADDPWDLLKVLRLHRRAGLGATWVEVQRDLAEGYEAALSRVLGGAAVGPDGRKAEVIDRFCDAMLRSYRQNPAALDSVRQAWLYRMVFTAWPLRERMLIAWHTHYATSEAKVIRKESLVAQHMSQRAEWRGPMGKLHLAMLRDEAMLFWLDGVENHRGAPNENLAREFFELFALGTGNYSEEDIRQSARALTGWQRLHNSETDLRYNDNLHDDGEKTILGQTGNWAVEDVVRITLTLPAAAERIAWRLWRTFISDVENPPPELLAGLAAAMRAAADVDVARGLETLLRSRLFHSAAYAGQRVLSPIEWLVGVLRSTESFPPHPDPLEIMVSADRQGERLFCPPNVAGWPGGLEWLTAPALVARQNFAAWLVSEESGIAADHWQNVAERGGAVAGSAEIDFWCGQLWGHPPTGVQRHNLQMLVDGGAMQSADLVRAVLLNPAAYVA